MERNIDWKKVSDGRFYGPNDMVKAGCDECRGCCLCCCGMGDSIVLDPLDVCRLTGHLRKSFEELLETSFGLRVVDGVILPYLRMREGADCCTFLDEKGRCGIHAYRPGFCRMFPLGRFYQDGGFRYFLQVHECPKENKSKVKVRKWIDTPDFTKYEMFINTWHYFLKGICEQVKEGREDAWNRQVSMYLLRQFYMSPYDPKQDFYQQFEQRLLQAKETLGTE